MTVPPSPSGSGMSFIPRDLVPIQVGRYSAHVYPKIDATMPIFERAHAFQVARSAIELIPVDTHVLLDALGTQLNCSAIVDSLLFDWRSRFDDHWGDFAHLTIQSFHNSAGTKINNTTIAGNPNILLPVQNGAVVNCRKEDVRFVRVLCSLDFASLFTIVNPGLTMLRVSFYIELPQMTVAMATAGGAAYNLTTWHGDADLSTLTREQFRTLILEPCLQDGPIALMPNDFNLSEANVDSTKIREDIHGKILKLGHKQICHAIFGQLCLGYSDQPHAALEHIHQTTRGPDGALVTLSVVEFYQRLMAASHPFQAQRTYSISICDRFIQHLDHRLVPSFCRLYPQHSSPQSLDAAYQHQQLSIILAVAQAAEDEVQQVQDIARGLINQGFFLAVSGAQAHPSQAETRATAYPSQAEKTLTQYGTPPDGGKTPTKKIQHCWGCDGNHSWHKGKEIVCPSKNDPAAQAKAKREYKDWLRATKKRKAGNKTVEFKDLPEDQQKKMCEAVLASDASTAVSTITGATVPSGQSVVFLLSVPELVPVLSNAPPVRCILPVPVQAAFPHITIQLGRDLGCPKCPSIRCVIDTAAALSTGNFHFFAQIAKAFPHACPPSTATTTILRSSCLVSSSRTARQSLQI